MFFFIGLGLGDESDISIKGLEAVRSCTRIFLDAYTSILGVDKSKLEKFYNVPEVILADREMVESEADRILKDADKENVAFLVVGDPFGATTHSDLYMRAVNRGIPVKIIHNASIINAVGSCGLQLYNYGPIITIPFFTTNWRPDSFYHKIVANYNSGLHTLCLLDIKVKEQSEENLFKGRKIYEAPRFMTTKQAISQLVELEGRHSKNVCKDDTIGIGMMRIGNVTQKIIVGTFKELLETQDEEFGGPLHSLIIPGRDLHEVEFSMMQIHALPNSVIKNMTFNQFQNSFMPKAH